MKARRALLYMPGDDLRKIHKSTTLRVDCICMDLEDGVALNRKSEARKVICESLDAIDFGHADRLVRINNVGSGLEIEDLGTILPYQPDGIVIPKVNNKDQVQFVSSQISAWEEKSNSPKGSIRLLVLVETAQAMIHLADIAQADPRIEGLIFGADDYAVNIGAKRSGEGNEVLYARSKVVTYAAAFNLQAIDMVYIDFHDNDGLASEAKQGAELGFSGKQIIHPNQVAIVQDAFTPNTKEITDAIQLIDEFTKHQAFGVGAFALDGKMIDAPLIKAAERVLSRARAAGKI
jgi:citrate lyase beta subunit